MKITQENCNEWPENNTDIAVPLTPTTVGVLWNWPEEANSTTMYRVSASVDCSLHEQANKFVATFRIAI